MTKVSCTLSEVRVCFDALILEYPSLCSHISSGSDIVSNPNFENGIVSLQRGTTSTLTDGAKESVKRFQPVEINNHQIANESRVLQALMNNQFSTGGAYVDTTGVCPTSNHLERLFSQCKLIRSQLRQGLAPITLEMLLFLKVNRQFWSVTDVELALNSWSGEDLIFNGDESEVESE